MVLQGEVAQYRAQVPCAIRLATVGSASGACVWSQAPSGSIPPTSNMRAGATFHTQGTTLLDCDSHSNCRTSWASMSVSATFLSGLCVLYRRECLLDLLEQRSWAVVARLRAAPGRVPARDGTVWVWGPCGPAGQLLRTCYGVGGCDDNDGGGARVAGWRLAIARGTYVHHLEHGPEPLRAQQGLAGLLPYLRAWESYTTRRSGWWLCTRVGWTAAWDVAMFGASLRAPCLRWTAWPCWPPQPQRRAAGPAGVAQGLPEPEQRLLAEAGVATTWSGCRPRWTCTWTAWPAACSTAWRWPARCGETSRPSATSAA